ncbi:uncharacterized protein LOC123979961 [Micropterus dolomieu]|uniref:uncharacterized protein LOC123979961 n=1 Tax=Micropterus dolomieu TaxID=147949 RepID=UPI001E8DE2A8|nr:uncharacterized protein LOC123979961 [Micropterus dolomieu]
MWVFLIMVCLLDQNQASPLPWEHSSLQPILQQQADQTMPSAVPDQLKTSSSSSSSSSASSESSQSSEGPQQLRERQALENAAVEQVDSAQESSEVLQPASNSSSTLWLQELVSLGGRAGERDGERDTWDDDSRERRHRVLQLTSHGLLSPPRLNLTADQDAAGPGEATGDQGGAITEGGVAENEVGVAAGEEGGVRGEEIDSEFPHLLADGSERPNGLTFDSHDQGRRGNEAELELGL